MFMYGDIAQEHEAAIRDFESLMKLEANNILIENIITIVNIYPNFVKEFIIKLDNFISYLSQTDISFGTNKHIVPFNSYNYRIGQLRYKYDEKLALVLESKIPQITIDILDFEKRVIFECIKSATNLKSLLLYYLNLQVSPKLVK